jgi:hypothetical protein
MHIIISAYNTLSTCNGEAKTILMFRIQYNNRGRTDNTVAKTKTTHLYGVMKFISVDIDMVEVIEIVVVASSFYCFSFRKY